jgi:hypothetical protein
MPISRSKPRRPMANSVRSILARPSQGSASEATGSSEAFVAEQKNRRKIHHRPGVSFERSVERGKRRSGQRAHDCSKSENPAEAPRTEPNKPPPRKRRSLFKTASTSSSLHVHPAPGRPATDCSLSEDPRRLTNPFASLVFLFLRSMRRDSAMRKPCDLLRLRQPPAAPPDGCWVALPVVR